MTKEKKWLKNLEQCLNRMPNNVEIILTDERIVLFHKGTIPKNISENLDVLEKISIGSILHGSIYICGETL